MKQLPALNVSGQVLFSFQWESVEMVKRTKKSGGAATKSSKAATVYPDITAEMRHEGRALSVDEVKELLGWTEEPDDEDWDKDFQLKDRYNKKIRLSNNPINRPIKHAIADRYALEFLRHVWQFNGQSVVFSKHGRLLDGQHRLVGFVLAEQERHINQNKWGEEPLKMEVLLAFGFEEDQKTADSYDTGQPRSLADVVYRHHKFDGKEHTELDSVSRHLATALRLVWLRSGGLTVSSAPKFPHSEAMTFYESHPLILDSIKFVLDADFGDGEKSEKLLKPFISIPYAAALHYLMSDVNSQKADDFWNDVARGEGLSKDDPVYSLRNYLNKVEGGSGKGRDKKVIAITKAWLAYVDGEKLTAAQVKPKQKKDDEGKFKIAEFPRIGGIDAEPEAPEELEKREQLILSALADFSGDDVTYENLSESTGLTKATCKRICNEGLLDSGYVATQVDEEVGETVSATPKGISQVRSA